MLFHDLLRDIDNGLPTGAVLDSIYEVENVLVALAEMEKKIEYYKGLRDWRVQSINAEIAKIEGRNAQLRELVLTTLKQLEPNQKTFHFPDVGKVTRKQLSGTWEIEDEQAALAALDKLGMKGRVIEVKESLNKRELKKVVAELSGQNTNVAGTAYKDGSESLSITFDSKTPKPTKKADAVPSDQTTKTMDALDALEV